jgi:hypothetical protein
MEDLAKNWPAYMALATFVWFIFYVRKESYKQDKSNKDSSRSQK